MCREIGPRRALGGFSTMAVMGVELLQHDWMSSLGPRSINEFATYKGRILPLSYC